MNGLHRSIYSKLIEHRSDMRNLPFAGAVAAAPNPSWDFISFDYVSSKASSFENELTAAVRDTTRVKHTHAAVTHDNSTRTAAQHKRKTFAGTKRGSTSPHKRAHVHVKSDLHCKWHPDAKSHSTQDCRNPGTTTAAVVPRTTTPRHASTAPTHSKDDLSKIQCYGCGKMGHYKPDCPSAKTEKPKHGFKGKNPKARAASVVWDSSVPAKK